MPIFLVIVAVEAYQAAPRRSIPVSRCVALRTSENATLPDLNAFQVHDLSSEIGEHFKNITNALVVFVKVGVPTIRFSQEHGSSNLLNLSTIATFFSAVTATTIQFTFEDNHSTVAKMVNGFWFSSLIFSIASAVNSLLGLTWRQAMYRSPGHRVPWWVSIWIKRSPLIFLVVSVAAFSIGLVLFTYSTSQVGESTVDGHTRTDGPSSLPRCKSWSLYSRRAAPLASRRCRAGSYSSAGRLRGTR